MKKSNDKASLVFVGPPSRRRPKLKKATWVSEKLLKKVEQFSIHVSLLTGGLEVWSGLEKRHLMQLRKEAKEYGKKRGKIISGEWSLKQPFEWMCRGWGAERHLSKPKWKDVKEESRTMIVCEGQQIWVLIPYLRHALLLTKWSQEPGYVPLPKASLSSGRICFPTPRSWSTELSFTQSRCTACSTSSEFCFLEIYRPALIWDLTFS